MDDLKKGPVCLFIPETGIYPYVRGMSVLGDSLREFGHKILITRCTGQMLRCPMMAMYHLPADVTAERKLEVCKICDQRLKDVLAHYNFSTVELSELVDKEVLKQIDCLVDVSENELEKLTYKGFPVGQIVQYDFILETKFPYYSNLSKEHKLVYSVYIKNTILSIMLADSICQRYNPVLLLTFNEYAQCQGVRYAAEMNNVRRMAMTYPVHYNVDASRFMLWSSTCEYWRYAHCKNWNNVNDMPIMPEHVEDCWRDAVFRMNNEASHIFSNKKSDDPRILFEKLGLNKECKHIVVYTSSSDERTSVETAMEIWEENPNIRDAFPDQISWLSMLRDYALSRKDIQIIVRIHPREGVRQFGINSRNLEILRNNFSKQYSNFVLIWPDDPISSYDLMEIADICLVQWSLMGLEAARMGIPVLSYTTNMLYPDDDFIQIADSPLEYKKRLDSLIDMDYTWIQLVKAFRYYHWRIFMPSLDLGATVPVGYDDDTVWPKAPRELLGVINDILLGKEDLIAFNFEQWKKRLSTTSLLNESVSMCKGIRFFLDKIFYPPMIDNTEPGIVVRILGNIWHRIITAKKMNGSALDYNLEYSEDISRLSDFKRTTKKDKKLRMFVKDGPFVILVHNGQATSRMSPMALRLARLHEYANQCVINGIK